MLHSSPTDSELMVQYQQGSEEAFKELYARHSGKIFGYLSARTRTGQEAADLFQEVFMKLHKSKHLYNKSLPVLPWIFSITHSVLIDGVRKIERKKEVSDFDFDNLESPEPSLTQQEIAPLINELPVHQQIALQMRYLDEKTFEEIAERLKTSPVNVRQIISRGIKRLKETTKVGGKS